MNWVFFIVACLAPILLTDRYHRHLLVLSGIFAILALSLDIIMGYLGELSLGHAAFFGLGAYVSALLSLNFNLPFWITMPLAAIITGTMGVLIGIPSFRLRGPYFAIITLGFAQIVSLIINNWISLTRGPMGITRIPAPSIHLPFLPSFEFNKEFSYYYIVLGLILFSIYITQRLFDCRSGRAILAIRENDALANSIGVNVYHFKIFAFGIGTTLAGISGAAYAHYFRVITPDLLGLYYMSNVLIMVIVGGVGSMGGAILGAFIFTILPEVLRIIENVRLIIFGAILLLSIVYLPGGVYRSFEFIALKIFKKSSE